MATATRAISRKLSVKRFNLQGTPLRIQYNVSENPYDEVAEKTKNKPLRRVTLSNRIAKRENRKDEKDRNSGGKVKKRQVSSKKSHQK